MDTIGCCVPSSPLIDFCVVEERREERGSNKEKRNTKERKKKKRRKWIDWRRERERGRERGRKTLLLFCIFLVCGHMACERQKERKREGKRKQWEKERGLFSENCF